MSEEERLEVLQGTLDLLVLKALHMGSLHGWGITELLRRGSEDVLQLGQGSLYPALYRLERQGFVISSWRATENNRRARYYTLTATGKVQLTRERENWKRMSRAVEQVLRMSPS